LGPVAHPAAALVLVVLPLHGRPGDLVGGLLARGVAAPLLGLVVLLPGAVERLLVDLLRALGQVVPHAGGELADPAVGHRAPPWPGPVGGVAVGSRRAGHAAMLVPPAGGGVWARGGRGLGARRRRARRRPPGRPRGGPA